MITFFEINILLIFTFFLFLMIQKGSYYFKYNLGKHFIYQRCAQLLIILAIISPIILKMIPINKMPISVPSFQSIDAVQDLNLKKTKHKIKKIMVTTPKTIEQIEVNYHFEFKKLMMTIWLIGCLYFLTKLGSNYLKLRKVLVDSAVFKKSRNLSIVITDKVLVPFSAILFGGRWVAIPIELLNNKNDFQIAIKHEIQHHRQLDTLWAIFIEILICLFYFNPIIFLWKNTIIELQEFSCDEALIGQKDVLSHDYGSCLLRVAETALKNRQMYAGTTCMAVVFKDSKYSNTFLLRRIEMIVNEKRSTSKWISICTSIFIALMTVTFAYGVEKVSRMKLNSINSGKLIIDNDIQKIADDALTKALTGTRFSSGFIIISDPMSGKILAVANADIKKIKKGNWALSQLIEPASLEKTFVIAQALEKNLTTPTDLHQCENGKYNYKGTLYRDWKDVGWKELSTSETLAKSSDICSIKIAEKIGQKNLVDMVEKFGFGEDGSAKDFPQARIGYIPDVSEQFLPHITLGYGIKNTPIEIMQAFGAIANGGNLMKPIMANNDKPEVMRRVLKSETAQKMKDLLEEVVRTGTGKRGATSSFYTTAGKTASARLNDYMNIEWYGVNKKKANFAGFVGFAPVKNPKVQVFVGLIDPDTDRNKTGAHGGEHAAPVFKEVAENVLAFMKVAPDKF